MREQQATRLYVITFYDATNYVQSSNPIIAHFCSKVLEHRQPLPDVLVQLRRHLHHCCLATDSRHTAVPLLLFIFSCRTSTASVTSTAQSQPAQPPVPSIPTPSHLAWTEVMRGSGALDTGSDRRSVCESHCRQPNVQS